MEKRATKCKSWGAMMMRDGGLMIVDWWTKGRDEWNGGCRLSDDCQMEWWVLEVWEPRGPRTLETWNEEHRGKLETWTELQSEILEGKQVVHKKMKMTKRSVDDPRCKTSPIGIVGVRKSRWSHKKFSHKEEEMFKGQKTQAEKSELVAGTEKMRHRWLGLLLRFTLRQRVSGIQLLLSSCWWS